MAGIKLKFSKKAIADLPLSPNKRVIYNDTISKYLHIYISKTTKVYYYFRKVRGDIIQIKIGDFENLTVADARHQCDLINAEILQGKDPAKKRDRSSNETVFKDLFMFYYDNHVKPNTRKYDEVMRQFNVYISGLHKKRVSTIQRTSIMQIHNKLKISNGKVISNRVIQLVRACYNFCIKNDFVLSNGEKITDNPADKIKLFKTQSRERFLQPDEMRRFILAIDNLYPEKWQVFFKLLLYTGARKNNALSITWQEIDFQNNIWTIPASKFKTGKENKVILTEELATLLLDYKKTFNIQSKFVFPAETKSGHTSEPRKAFERLVKDAKITDINIHDVRRTFGSWQAGAGASLQVIGKSLGHANISSTQIYSRLNLDPVRKSVNNVVKLMQAEAEIIDIEAMPILSDVERVTVRLKGLTDLQLQKVDELINSFKSLN